MRLADEALILMGRKLEQLTGELSEMADRMKRWRALADIRAIEIARLNEQIEELNDTCAQSATPRAKEESRG